MLLRRGIPAGDRGFTLVEVMVAVALLLVGVLGTVSMVTGANAQTAVTKSREGATNLARELIDAARGVDYDGDLTPGGIAPALQAQPGLADSDPGTAGWQISRRGVTYTVASLPVCMIDGQADGYGAHPAPSDPAATPFCAGQTTGSSDPNPDDFRRMDVTLTWSVLGHPYSLRESTLIINPSGGIGPTIKSLCRVLSSSTATCSSPLSGPVLTETSLNLLAITTPADTTTWAIDNGTNPVDVSSSNPSAPQGSAWNFTWNIGPVVTDASFTCGTPVTWTLDGNYIVTAQGISGIGSNAVPGVLKPYTVTINRSAPYSVCGLAGGYDQMPASIAGHPTAVDLEWQANQERDVIGYRVYRERGGADPNDLLVCDTTGATAYPFSSGNCVCTSKTACLDTSPRSTSSTVAYRVTAVDQDPSGNARETGGSYQTLVSIDQSSDAAPTFPSSPTYTVSNGQPLIQWPAASDSDGTIKYYRIYRNGTAYTNRYEQLPANATSYVDPAPDAGGDTYWVTAVDDRYDESAPLQAVGP